ncbi:hypothetical protein [Vibrio parahaemolyticus]|uniref:hypothetical protein n=1 Tax=Vibrio parahaemolyticus TaxID=670 RepID=UPI0024AF3EEB|nr:hypothetical protein [Vibrio parahaemolyticus]MDI7854634.1 type II and III secretion system protein [Vibrio parahaemolyticus]
MKKSLLLTAILLSGCSSQQMLNEDNFKDESNILLLNEIERLKEKENDYEEISLKLVQIEERKTINKTIDFNFTTEANLKDLIDVMEYHDINVIVDSNIDTNQAIIINKYKGSFENLIEAIAKNTNLTFEIDNGFLYIKELKNYKIKVVQDKEIIEAVKTELEKLEEKVKELIVSESAGLFSFKSDYKTFNKIKETITDINNNTSLINIDLSLVNVELNQTKGNGFDWESLNIAANLDPSEFVEETINLVGGDRLSFSNNYVNFSAVLNVLNSYGTSETLQNTSIKTLSGKEAIFKTTEKTPYIDKVEISNNGDFAQTGFSTAEAETGLEVKLLPYFDKDSKMVNIKVDVVKSALKGFLNVNTSEIELQQPQTEEQNFSSVIRLKAGESSVIGGIIYYKEKRSGNNLINELTQSNKLELSKNALFIIVKPSVKTYIYK